MYIYIYIIINLSLTGIRVQRSRSNGPHAESQTSRVAQTSAYPVYQSVSNY